MREKLTEEEIREALKSRVDGIKTYEKIMKRIYKIKEGKDEIDEDFKNDYKNFYKMNMARSLKEEFYNKYFGYMKEQIRNDSLEFGTVLNALFDKSINRVEASFSSKLLATINPDKPVWDRNVLNTLKDNGDVDIIPRSRKNKKRQIDETIKTYCKLEDVLKREYLEAITADGKKYVEIFDETLDKDIDVKNITEMKKIDLILWSTYTKKNKKK